MKDKDAEVDEALAAAEAADALDQRMLKFRRQVRADLITMVGPEHNDKLRELEERMREACVAVSEFLYANHQAFAAARLNYREAGYRAATRDEIELTAEGEQALRSIG